MRLALVLVPLASVFFVACGADVEQDEPVPAPAASVQQAATATTAKPTTNWTYTNGGVTHEDTWDSQR